MYWITRDEISNGYPVIWRGNRPPEFFQGEYQPVRDEKGNPLCQVTIEPPDLNEKFWNISDVPVGEIRKIKSIKIEFDE